MKLRHGTFSYLPDLTDEEIAAQVRYALQHGWPVSVEYTDDPHPRNVYWEMWGLPMFDLAEPDGVLARDQRVPGHLPEPLRARARVRREPRPADHRDAVPGPATGRGAGLPPRPASRTRTGRSGTRCTSYATEPPGRGAVRERMTVMDSPKGFGYPRPSAGPGGPQLEPEPADVGGVGHPRRRRGARPVRGRGGGPSRADAGRTRRGAGRPRAGQAPGARDRLAAAGGPRPRVSSG